MSYSYLKYVLISFLGMHNIPFLGSVTISLTYPQMMDSSFTLFIFYYYKNAVVDNIVCYVISDMNKCIFIFRGKIPRDGILSQGDMQL